MQATGLINIKSVVRATVFKRHKSCPVGIPIFMVDLAIFENRVPFHVTPKVLVDMRRYSVIVWASLSDFRIYVIPFTADPGAQKTNQRA